MLKTIKWGKKIRSGGLRAELHLFNAVGLVKKVTPERRLGRRGEPAWECFSRESSQGP